MIYTDDKVIWVSSEQTLTYFQEWFTLVSPEHCQKCTSQCSSVEVLRSCCQHNLSIIHSKVSSGDFTNNLSCTSCNIEQSMISKYDINITRQNNPRDFKGRHCTMPLTPHTHVIGPWVWRSPRPHHSLTCWSYPDGKWCSPLGRTVRQWLYWWKYIHTIRI